MESRAVVGGGVRPAPHQGDLLRDLAAPEVLALDTDCEVIHHRAFLTQPVADDRLEALLATTPWQQDHIGIYGHQVPIPRLQSWHADGGTYTYSGIELPAKPWTDALAELRDEVAAATGCGWNSVLANLYRDGGDGVAWHRDDEPDLGANPPIASVSLGATRRFVLRNRSDHAQRVTLDLEHGSLLVMRGSTQHRWEHQVSKTARLVGPRVNLTFRILAADGLVPPL